MNTRERNLLLVDDADNDRMMFTIAFRRANAKGLRMIQPLEGGAEAIAYLQGKGQFGDRERYPYPDLLVLDLNMPVTSGFDVLEWLKFQPRRPTVAILSDSYVKEDVVKAQALGARYFFQKPDGLPGLVDLIRELAIRTQAFRESINNLQHRTRPEK